MSAPVQAGLFPLADVPAAEHSTLSKAGPKSAAEASPLPWAGPSEGVDALDWFATSYLLTPRGKGAGEPMRLRPWQLEMCKTLFDPETATAVWVLPRGNGKSGISAAIALFWLFRPGALGARVAIVAQDERSAKRLLHSAARMVETNQELASRARVYRDRIVVPGSDSELVALPAEAHRVEGSDLDLAILDEIGFMPQDTYEAAILSVGKVEGGKTLCIGTPSPARFRDVSPLWDLVTTARANPHDRSLQLVEWGAPSDADILSPATWAQANPAYGDWLTEKSVRAQAPPKTRELEFRRARLGQWVDGDTESAFDVEAWAACARPNVRIPAGARVVLALDGSMNGDSTAIVVGSISRTPHYQIGGLWEPSEHPDGWEVPHLEVEDRIRELAEYYAVEEVIADPFRWQRTLQVLDESGLPVAQFPQTSTRLTPATIDLRAAIAEKRLTHSGEKKLSEHVTRTVIEESSRGIKLAKPAKDKKIDLAACLIMAHSRATWLAGGSRRKRKRKVRGYAA